MTVAPALPRHLLDIRTILLEPEVEEYTRGREILARFPNAKRVPVASHWRVPAVRDGDAGDWLQTKQGTLVLGVKRGLAFRPNGRSADFIAPSTSNGCAMACAYCYVARRKGHGNPVTVFVNIEQVCLLRRPAQGPRQPGDGVRQHRAGLCRYPAPCQGARAEDGAQPGGPGSLGV
jgi:spore photoproduct lyase